MGNYNYGDVINKLDCESAIITFVKSNGEKRVMLGTRNMSTVNLSCNCPNYALVGHDKRCNLKNGNIAVIDMAIGESRAFNIDRVINIDWLGILTNENEIEDAHKKLFEAKQVYSKPVTMDDL